MTVLRLLFALSLLVAGPALAQNHGDPGHEPAAQGPAQDHGGHGFDFTGKTLAEIADKDFFTSLYVHLHPHEKFVLPLAADEGTNASLFTFYDVNLFQLISLALCLLVFLPVVASFGKARPSWLVRMFRGFALWIRDEMVAKVMSEEDTRRFTPFFLYLFFFLLFMNLLGLVPGSVTATATLFVTAALSLMTFAMMLAGGMMQQGVVAYWKNLLPHGLPAFLIPLMVPLELIGLVVKPFALTIRLFANMLAGHLVIYSFIGMIFVFAKMFEGGAMSWATAVPAVGLAVFIYIIEGFVAMLQTYIFVFLSLIFVQQSLHPAH